ncbi:uncharacterized protein [Coffea arabica]|uniref:ATP-dependent DNA helicase n=1 Tax=Coffea arabica TaxID=13443 RepID=A0ABM4U9V3_COFAR
MVQVERVKLFYIACFFFFFVHKDMSQLQLPHLVSQHLSSLVIELHTHGLRFLWIFQNKTCQLSKQSSVARLIVDDKLMLWAEASMAKRETIEAFHYLLMDIMESDVPFRGKTIIFCDDFRLTLPVIEHLPAVDLIKSTVLYSHLWSHMRKLQLGTNMRAALDPAFSAFLFREGEGVEPVDEHGQISLLPHMVIPYHNKEESLDRMQDVIPIKDVLLGLKVGPAKSLCKRSSR